MMKYMNGKNCSICKYPTRKANGAGSDFKNLTRSEFGSGAGIMYTRPKPHPYTYSILKKFKNPNYKY